MLRIARRWYYSVSNLKIRQPKKREIIMLVLSIFAVWNLSKNGPGTLDMSSFQPISSTSFSNINGQEESSSSLSSTSHHFYNSNYRYNDVLYFDTAALENIRATFEGGRSYIEWSPRSIPDVIPTDDLHGQFQVTPLLATVDRRPIIVRKQLQDDAKKKKHLVAGGDLMGCALTSTTFVSNLDSQHLKHYKEYMPTCDVCFQFSNREDMEKFVPGVGYEPLKPLQKSLATKCFGGKASVSARFADWQQKDQRFKDFGYPWIVDCILPNGIEELTCREISRMQNEIQNRDDLQNIFFRTRFYVDGWFGIWSKQFVVHSSWPWKAVMSHDDDRRKIAKQISMSWDDAKSWFVPKSAQELKLAHVEGPGYDKTEYKGSLSLKSVSINKESRGGIHPRLISNLFHLIRNAPGSTHMIAVVDGQARRSYERMIELLETKVSVLYPKYGDFMFKNTRQMKQLDLIPIGRMGGSKGLRSNSDKSLIDLLRSPSNSDMSLIDLLRLRQIKIHMVPVTTPSLSFERNVCGGQYPFAPYLAARFAADYHAMMFIDGDTAIVESSRTLQDTLYDRFFSKNSSKCAGHRLRLIEQYVKPQDENIDRVLQCSHDLISNRNKWNFAMKNCHLKEGHIVARTDSIFAFSVHHPDTLKDYLPKGVEDCITPGNNESDRYFLKDDEFVQLHLRDRERKVECTCFDNQPR